ncbi:MAG: PHP domain-containing protein [Myxococcota bacterium]
MPYPYALNEDMHVHSVYSDGKGTLEENIEAAERAGLTRLGLVDHVRRDTTYLPEFVAHVERLRPQTSVELTIGIEAKFLDRSGALDVPERIDGVDFVYAADHQLPIDVGCITPKEAVARMEAGHMTPEAVIESLVDANCNAMVRPPRLVIAHLGSILPKMGLSEEQVPHQQLVRLAAFARHSGTYIEIDERWRCPGPKTLKVFLDYSVPVLCSSDAHRPNRIGRYSFNAETHETLSRSAA